MVDSETVEVLRSLSEKVLDYCELLFEVVRAMSEFKFTQGSAQLALRQEALYASCRLLCCYGIIENNVYVSHFDRLTLLQEAGQELDSQVQFYEEVLRVDGLVEELSELLLASHVVLLFFLLEHFKQRHVLFHEDRVLQTQFAQSGQGFTFELHVLEDVQEQNSVPADGCSVALLAGGVMCEWLVLGGLNHKFGLFVIF